MSSDRQPSLLTQRKFLPYFVTQFFGAFNDNIFKNVLLLFVAFAGSSALPISSNLFINLAAGLFILSFFHSSFFLPLLEFWRINTRNRGLFAK